MTTFGGKTIPPLFRGAGGDGDFTNPPLNFTGFTSEVQVVQGMGGFVEAQVRFLGSFASNPDQGLLEELSQSAGNFVSAPNQNNWHSNANNPAGNPDAGNWAIGISAFTLEPGTELTDTRMPGSQVFATGIFFPLTSQRAFQLFAVAGGGLGRHEAIVTFVIADVLDTSDIQAQATIRMIHERVPP